MKDCYRLKMMRTNNIYIIFFHFICWILVALPIMFVPQHIQRDTVMFLIRLCFPMFMCMVFYMNYLWFVPRFFMERRINAFVCVNVVVMLLLGFFMQQLMDMMHAREVVAGWNPPHKQPPMFFSSLLRLVVREVFPLVLSAAVATLLRIAMRWQEAEKARKEMEIQKTEAELKNLRNQINPHFLLNTLNNIYALISFDRDKAQKAVLSLSAMLRQMLYGTKQNSVSLKDETEFIRNYIDLMRIRMSKDVKIDVDISIPSNTDVRIAPFILISLVENAFKHGISPVRPSFISIRLVSDGKMIECEIKNSNFPKTGSDKSGHGIGLSQVARRLNLAYKDRYEWIKGTDERNEIYFSKIMIYDTELRDNR